MLVGQKLGPFAIEKELGSGAMGTVFRACNSDTGQHVAIKVTAPGLSTNETAVARFKREAAILKQLEHPNIVRLIATGRFGKTPFYAMEYVEGESLDHVMSRRGRISWEEVVTLGQQLCDALKHAHEQGIIHRDLKPSNIMVLPDGTLKLMDFGIAKALDVDLTALTGANNAVGTAAYMSPEQCRGERDLTPKTDLYSMGVMFYELLTGRKPFIADSPMEMFMQHVKGTFERPSRLVLDIPVWLDTLVCQLLEKEPDKRPLNADLVGQALSRVKEKVEAQISAGVDTVRGRALGRTKLDESDKEAARTLLGKKRKKKAQAAFYEQRWFQATGIVFLLAVIVFVIYLAFKPVSAETLYAEIQELDKSDSRAEAKRKIEEFLERFPDHPQAREVQRVADRIAADDEEDSLRSRMNRARILKKPFDPEGKADGLAYWALRHQEFGDLSLGRQRWQELKQLKDAAPRNLALLADKKLRDLETKVPQPKTESEKQKERETRSELVRKKLKDAIDLITGKKMDEAQAITEDIVELYGASPELSEQVDEARKLSALIRSPK